MSQAFEAFALKYRGPLMSVYGVAALMMATPTVEWLTTLGVPQLGNVQWRFGAYGLATSLFTGWSFAVALAMLIAMLMGHRRVLKALAILAFVITGFLALGFLGFGLDTLQMRNRARPEILMTFYVTTVKALGMTLLAGALFGWMGLASWRVAKKSKGEGSGSRRSSRVMAEESG